VKKEKREEKIEEGEENICLQIGPAQENISSPACRQRLVSGCFWG
jgi:hypothetical protein